MKSSYEKIDPTHIKLDITLTKKDWHTAANRVYGAFAHEVKVPGFRPGRAPRKVIDQYVGAKQVFDSIREDIINETVLSAIRKHELQPITRPELELETLEKLESVPDGEDITFFATIELWPEVPQFAYKGLKVLVKKRVVTDENIEKAIEGIQFQSATKTEIDDRPVEDGDWVTFQFRGVAEPEPAEKDESSGEPDEKKESDGPLIMEDTYSIHVGHDTSLPGIGDSLKGLKKEEERDFEIVLPDDFPREDMRNRTMQCHAVMKNIEEMELPDITDEFVKENLKLQDVEELKANIRLSMENSHNDLKRKEANEALDEFFTNTISFESPKAFIESRRETILENMRSYYDRMDQDLNEIMRDKEKAEQIQRDVDEEARKQILIEMIYDDIARKEKIEVEIDEVKNYLYMMQSMQKLKEKDVKKLLKDENFLLSVRNDIKNKKVIDFLFQNNDITEVDDTDAIEKRVELTGDSTGETVSEDTEALEQQQETSADDAPEIEAIVEDNEASEETDAPSSDNEDKPDD